jgi:hypothetical protein
VKNSQGIATNNRQLTGKTSGATADVNEPTGTTKNRDANVYVNCGRYMNLITLRMILSVDGTWNNTLGMTLEVNDAGGSSSLGLQDFTVSDDEIKLNSGDTGYTIMNDSGQRVNLNTQDYNYSLDAEVRY